MPGTTFRKSWIAPSIYFLFLLIASVIAMFGRDSASLAGSAASNSQNEAIAELGADSAANIAPSQGSREPAYRDFTLSPGTLVHLTLDTSVASDTSRREDRVRAHVRQPIVIDDVDVVPTGSRVEGVVSSVQRPGRVKGRAQLAMTFDELVVGDRHYDVRVSNVVRNAPSTRKADATDKIAIPAAGGAVVGALVGGKKGAAIGAGAGGAGGTAFVLSTRGREVRLGSGTSISVRLVEPLTIRVPSSQRAMTSGEDS